MDTPTWRTATWADAPHHRRSRPRPCGPGRGAVGRRLAPLRRRAGRALELGGTQRRLRSRTTPIRTPRPAAGPPAGLALFEGLLGGRRGAEGTGPDQPWRYVDLEWPGPPALRVIA